MRVWVKHRNQDPVEILLSKDTTVSHLLAEYQESASGKQAASEQLTLHESLYTPSLESDCLLSSVSGGQPNNPLIIKSKAHPLTINECLLRMPPPISSTDCNSLMRQSTKQNRYLERKMELWPDFEHQVTDYIKNNDAFLSQTMEEPFYRTDLETFASTTMLPSKVQMNLFCVAAAPFAYRVETEKSFLVTEHAGCVKDDQLVLFPYQVVDRWISKHEKLLHHGIGAETDPAAILEFLKVYHLLIMHMRQFGVLTSYDHTFFLQRQMLADGTETMMVSRAVARDAQSPTVYQCLAYLCDIADSTTFQCSLPLQCQFAYDKYLVPDDAILSEHELSFDKILGSGKFHVYHELRNNWAVKAIDLPRQQKYLLKFWNEIKMYQQLKDLQGDGIPQLKLYGYWQGGKYFMAFTICGRVPQSLTLAQKKRMVEILDQVHAKDVLQGSIKTSNMLVDEDGRVYLIDFERGKTTTSNYRKAIENQKMVTCMNGLRFS